MTTSRRFNLSILCDNAAFDGDPSREIARILRAVADRIEGGDDYLTYRNLYDANGNAVGTFAIKDHNGNTLRSILAMNEDDGDADDSDEADEGDRYSAGQRGPEPLLDK